MNETPSQASLVEMVSLGFAELESDGKRGEFQDFHRAVACKGAEVESLCGGVHAERTGSKAAKAMRENEGPAHQRSVSNPART